MPGALPTAAEVWAAWGGVSGPRVCAESSPGSPFPRLCSLLGRGLSGSRPGDGPVIEKARWGSRGRGRGPGAGVGGGAGAGRAAPFGRGPQSRHRPLPCVATSGPDAGSWCSKPLAPFCGLRGEERRRRPLGSLAPGPGAQLTSRRCSPEPVSADAGGPGAPRCWSSACGAPAARLGGAVALSASPAPAWPEATTPLRAFAPFPPGASSPRRAHAPPPERPSCRPRAPRPPSAVPGEAVARFLARALVFRFTVPVPCLSFPRSLPRVRGAAGG